MSTDRHFIVTKIGLQGTPSVEIRQVEPGSCALTLSRTEAWTFANKVGQPMNVKGGAKHGFLPIFFTCLGGSRKQVATAAKNDAPQAELTAQPVVAEQCVTPAPVSVEYEWLRTQNVDGNTFLTSLKSQLEAKGTLSDKQRECIKSAMLKVAEPETKEDTTGVPAGRYAIEREGVIKFYKIEKGKVDTRWAGMTFVKVQASDDTFPVRSRVEREDILHHIADDIPAAMALYGKEIGRCGHCHKVLTSEWRKKGIGPICNEKMGW